jgi:hypothetical protein
MVVARIEERIWHSHGSAVYLLYVAQMARSCIQGVGIGAGECQFPLNSRIPRGSLPKGSVGSGIDVVGVVRCGWPIGFEIGNSGNWIFCW